jgi:hypothetical protein
MVDECAVLIQLGRAVADATAALYKARQDYDSVAQSASASSATVVEYRSLLNVARVEARMAQKNYAEHALDHGCKHL